MFDQKVTFSKFPSLTAFVMMFEPDLMSQWLGVALFMTLTGIQSYIITYVSVEGTLDLI